MKFVDPVTLFEEEKKRNIQDMADNQELLKLSNRLLVESGKFKYSYNFTWLGRPIIQFPQDIVVLQELVWEIKPEIIIETGIAHGGSLIFHASMLELLGGGRQVIGVDIDIREHNRVEIEKHPMSRRITMIQGSSTDQAIFERIKGLVGLKKPVMVVLDSNHTHIHVLKELELYSTLVTKGSSLVVLDTVIEDMPADFFPDRPWGIGNNPKTAVNQFLSTTDRFVIDKELENKLLLTAAPSGFLKCVKEPGS